MKAVNVFIVLVLLLAGVRGKMESKSSKMSKMSGSSKMSKSSKSMSKMSKSKTSKSKMSKSKMSMSSKSTSNDKELPKPTFLTIITPTTTVVTPAAPIILLPTTPVVVQPIAPIATPGLFIPAPPNTPANISFDYIPGDLQTTLTDKNNREILVSRGLMGRAIAYSGETVEGTTSNVKFHSRPDGAAIFAKEGGFVYVSNSEEYSGKGGVGVLEFNYSGDVVGYYRILDGTTLNCSGGPTPWGTWISCEENLTNGQVWQTDPMGVKSAKLTAVVPRGGSYESFAYDDRADVPRFFVTEDYDSEGPLVRFTPDAQGMACYQQPNPVDQWCTLESGTHDFLQLQPYPDSDKSEGTFTWVSDASDANPDEYPGSEGMDIVDGTLYFTSKYMKALFTLDLDSMTYTKTSTQSGAFDLEPDQLQVLVGDSNNLVYFCEDGGSNCDVHARDKDGNYLTILEGTDYDTETTGLDFSPDAMFMFVAFQEPGVVWQFWRLDGKPFTGSVVDIKYHTSAQQTSRLLRRIAM